VKYVAILHGNLRPHTAAHTAKDFAKWKQVLKRRPFRLHLAPSDHHPFLPLKDFLRGHHFASGQEVKEAVHAWLVTR
jgi:hypothetical protein